MGQPIVKYEWSGRDEAERWWLRVEHDCMEIGQPLVVTVELEQEFDERTVHNLACLTPAEAREVATALTTYAFLADAENRKRPHPAEEEGG